MNLVFSGKVSTLILELMQMDLGYKLAPALFVLLVLLCFFLLLHAILFLLSRTGGWHRWAVVFTQKNVHSLVKLRWANGKMYGFAKYGNTLVLGANEEGLILATIVWFKPFHPTLVLPWGQIRTKRAKYFLSDVIEISMPQVPGVSIKLFPRELKKMADKLQKISPQTQTKVSSLLMEQGK